MTPAEIAKKLTPAQVRALRDLPKLVDRWSASLADAKLLLDWKLTRPSIAPLGGIYAARTDRGDAVLAELDKGETNGQG